MGACRGFVRARERKGRSGAPPRGHHRRVAPGTSPSGLGRAEAYRWSALRDPTVIPRARPRGTSDDLSTGNAFGPEDPDPRTGCGSRIRCRIRLDFPAFAGAELHRSAAGSSPPEEPEWPRPRAEGALTPSPHPSGASSATDRSARRSSPIRTRARRVRTGDATSRRRHGGRVLGGPCRRRCSRSRWTAETPEPLERWLDDGLLPWPGDTCGRGRVGRLPPRRRQLPGRGGLDLAGHRVRAGSHRILVGAHVRAEMA